MVAKNSKVDISSFMGVINSTVQTPGGIKFAGEHMPSGKDVTSAGVTKAQLMQDRSLAEQWYESIKGEYERQIDEANKAASRADIPELVIRGEAAPSSVSRGGEAPVAEHTQSLEAQLQGSCERWQSQLCKLDSRLADLELERRETLRSLRKSEAALQAVLGIDGDE